jgi:glycosyltransferase involved in cell wall biosynthesis
MTARPIVVISQLPPPTHGSTVMTKILLDVLVESGDTPILVDRRFSKSIGEVGSISLRKIIAAPVLAVRLMSALSRRPRLCIFFCTNRSFSFLVDVLLGEILRLFRIPTVTYIHTRGYAALAERSPLWRFLVARLLGCATTTVCLGGQLLAELTSFVPKESIVIIGNTAEAPPSNRSERERGHILFLSNLLEEKGADVFVEMAIKLCKQDRDLHFSLVGSSADAALTDRLRARVARSRLSDRIVFTGPALGAEKWNVLASAEVLVFPTRYRYEAQPLTIIEALSVGVPVVATDVGAISELVQDGVNGRLISEASVESLERAVLDVVGDAETSNQLAIGAVQTFERFHSREVFRASWAEVLDETGR